MLEVSDYLTNILDSVPLKAFWRFSSHRMK